METDRRLMQRVTRGDGTAFTELAERFGGRLLTVAGRLLGSRQDAEDAVQRALLQCYTGAAGYQPRWAVSTWLYRILTNVCVDELRRRSTRAAHAERSAAAAVLEAPGNHRPPGAYMDLHRALERVPREARVLLALRYVDGLSYGELARIRGISVNTVKSQLARGKSLLRAELGRRGIDHE
ncbi:MAG TPA: sigma-70 family RNA polymerase sigma factor [Methylomirabilota bacterium]|nr:sigma-70 family RNA polymerase sigma factor [Methylomirabilota bacterium]